MKSSLIQSNIVLAAAAYVFARACKCVCVFVYVCMYVCMYVCVCVCTRALLICARVRFINAAAIEQGGAIVAAI